MKWSMTREDDGSKDVLKIEGVDGLPSYVVDEGVQVLTAQPLVVWTRSSEEPAPQMELGGVYAFHVEADEIDADIAAVHCLGSWGPTRRGALHGQYCVVSIGRCNWPLAMILQAWSEGISWDWRSLDSTWSNAWLVACMHRWAGAVGWHQSVAASRAAELAPEMIRGRDDLYCLLGEAFFGYRGYVGSNLDAMQDVLQSNAVHGFRVVFRDPKTFAATLADSTGRHDYFAQVVEVMEESGVLVSFEEH